MIILLISLCLAIITYFIYIQVSVGNIWYRNNQFRPDQIINYLRSPFYDEFFWKLEYIDLNWIMFVTFVTLILYFSLKIIKMIFFFF